MQSAWISFTQGVATQWQSMAEGLGANMPKFAAGVVILLLTWWLSGVAMRATRRVLARTSTTGNVDVVVSRLLRGAIVVVGVVAALGVMGVNVAAIVTSLGLAGLTVGLALRDALANYVAGILLLLHRPFAIGDTILVDGQEGEVLDVTTRTTALRAPDGREVHIPNDKVFNAVVINVTRNPVRRFELKLLVPSKADVAGLRSSLVEVVSAVDGVMTHPAPDVAVGPAGPYFSRAIAHGWVDTTHDALGDVHDAAYAAASARLRELGLALHREQ
jgi:small conductance mechanosensitive channel